MDVAAWLKGLDLERYVPAFRDNEIDWYALPKLSAEDLKDLGVVLGGHRRRLLDAITALGATVPAASETGSPHAAPPRVDAERRQLTSRVLRPCWFNRASFSPRSGGFA
jgi:hypothetical protein